MTTESNDPARVHPFDALATIGCVYLALVTIGFAAFRYLAVLPTGTKRNQDVTFFSSANVVSLSGFDHVNSEITNYPTLGLIVVSALALLSALTSLIGGGYLLARVMRCRIPLTTLAVWAGAILLLPLLAAPLVGGFNAIATSTGLGLWGRPRVGWIGSTIAIGMATLGLLGVLPLRQLIWPARPVERNASCDLAWTLIGIATLVVVGAIALIACGTPWSEAGVRSLSLRSFGNAAGPELTASPAMPWVAMLFSIVGAAPASTAGGLSVLPIVIATRGAVAAMRGRPVDRIVGVALAWIASFGLALVVFTVTLATLAPALSGERALMLVCSALGNVGINYEPVGLTGASLFALSAAMLVGRLLPLVMLAWLAMMSERAPVILSSSATRDS